jgi:RimJ/RimL family protein N-acetyltransferase
MEQPPLVNIVGERVALGPLRRELVPAYQRWLNDFAGLHTLGVPIRPMTMEGEMAWFDHAATAPGEVNFTIYDQQTWTPIGTTALMAIDERHRRAGFGLLIGEPQARGKGFGTETTRLMLDYAFTALGLHNVMLSVYEFNLAGRRAYEKAGFREFGRRRQCHWSAGRLWDEISMDCLSTEFTGSVLAGMLTIAPRGS